MDFTYSRSEPWKLRRSCEALAASCMRSSSSRIVFSYAHDLGGTQAPVLRVGRAPGARARASPRGPARCRRAPWSQHLDDDLLSALSAAACTWAIEAAASGASSKLSKASATGRPYARSTISAPAAGKAVGRGPGASRARRRRRRGAGRAAWSAWPNLTKIGPSASNASRIRSPRVSPRRALEPRRRRHIEDEPERPEKMRREDDVVEPVLHEHALNREQAPPRTSQPHVRWAAAYAPAGGATA